MSYLRKVKQMLIGKTREEIRRRGVGKHRFKLRKLRITTAIIPKKK